MSVTWTNLSPISFSLDEPTTITHFALHSEPKPMSRKKARKAYTQAEEDFYTAKAAIQDAEHEVVRQRGAMEEARTRMGEAARILAAK